jgi:hypothetical protein
MHYGSIDAAAADADPDLLKDDPGAHCVVGCYRCLLSYYNQPDHELIDRTSKEAKILLLRLARCQIAGQATPAEPKTNGEWHAALARWGLPAPDELPLIIEGTTLPLAWRAQLAAAAFDSVPDKARTAAEERGFNIALLPDTPGDAPPTELVELLGTTA